MRQSTVTVSQVKLDSIKGIIKKQEENLPVVQSSII